MRGVSRPNEEPEHLRTKGLEEQSSAAAKLARWLADGATDKKPSTKFRAYKHNSVKELLVEAFEGKCAYCESYYSSTQPMDVEHYRPKGAVDGEDTHPGYYWLAATWTNLLPSCIDCNRRRLQFDVQTSPDQKISLGKKDRFPVAGIRATEPMENIDEIEMPLLVDPCLTNPAAIFKYDHEFGFVLPRFNSGKKHQRAVASIATYGLNRSGLVTDRMHIIRQIDHHLELVKKLQELQLLIEKQAPDVEEARDLVDELISLELVQLSALGNTDRPYSGMVNQLLDDLDR